MISFEKLKAACAAVGITEVEVYRVLKEGSSVSTFDGKVDQNLVYSAGEVYVRGVKNGKIASLYAERDEDAEIPAIVSFLHNNLGVIESEDPYFIYGGSKEYPTVEEAPHDYGTFTQADRLALCLKMESTLREGCGEIVNTEAEVSVEECTVMIENTSGLSVCRKSSGASVGCVGVVKKDGDVKQGYYGDYVKNLADVDFGKLYRYAAERPLSAIGAVSLPSGKYPVVFENRRFAGLLSCFLSMFSGDAAVKKLSLLGDKLGEKVFGDNITFTDDPLDENANHRISFDDEGVAAFRKTVVEKGVFKTFLHSLKTAKMMDASPTGNGFKESGGGIGVRPTNLRLEGGGGTLEELLSPIEDGVFVTELMGMHAGVNAVSGAFNLQASGYRIRKGKLEEPITLFVVSGNILDLLNGIAAIGGDFEYSRGIGCGSVHVASLSVSGKNE